MNIQLMYSLIFMFLIIVQLVCSFIAYKSDRPIKKYTIRLNLAIIIPIVANILIINSYLFNKKIVEYSYYLSYIGMTIILITLVYFTTAYCKGVDKEHKHRPPYIMYIIGTIDIIQITLGIFLNHVITIEETLVEGKIYYCDYPLIGLTMHRIIDYSIFVSTLLIYIVCAIKTSKLYREKYIIIIITMLLAGITQGAFIASRTPIDKSIIVHGIFGLVVFYFSILYKPLRLLDSLLSNVASNMNDSVFVLDNSGKCVWVNENGYKLLNLDNHKLNQVKDELINMFGDLSNNGDNWTTDIYKKEIDKYYYIEKKSVKTNNKKLDGSFIIIKDTTEKRKEIERKLYEANHDNLTGLYNANYLFKHIITTLSTSTEEYYVVYMNIKNFKVINDIFGKQFGDRVLIQLAEWLNNNLKGIAIYGRLVGDTFGLFMPISKFDEQLYLDGLSNFIVKYKYISHHICIHLGVYQIHNTNMEISTMFDRAHLSIINVEENYKTVIRYYDDNIRNNLLEEQKIINSFDEAIKQKQIIPYLQPIIDITGKIVGAEALARWIHPDLGFLSPIKFISIFEKNGMIIELDSYIWDSVCQILDKWKTTNPDLFISINISPKDFYFTNVVEILKEDIKKYNIDPSKLRIEITETAMMFDSEEKIKIMELLRKEGFIIEMDDFGSGYSSLNLLKDMPVDVLKLDMKFLSDTSNKSETIIRNVINLSKELDMTALTEGVETQQQYNQLIGIGCSLFQGYYFAKPMPINEFNDFIRKRGEINE